MISSFGSFGIPGDYTYADETTDEFEDSTVPPEISYDYGDLSFENLDSYALDMDVSDPTVVSNEEMAEESADTA